VSVPLWAWFAVVAVILAMLAIDLVAHRDAHVIGVREAALWSAFWVVLGVGFGVVVWWVSGGEFAAQYFSGYVIEKSLAVDNVFVWAIIFSYFAVPREYQHRVLFYGVVGALIFRAAFIAAGSLLIASLSWVLYLFGAFLVLTGVQMLRHRHEHIDVERSRVLRWFRRRVPHTDLYHGQRFMTREAGRWVATPLLAVLVMVEVTDIIFAVDSIPAIFAVTQEPFLVFTANAFAILGLRAMYFLLADLIHRFTYLKAGLALVLVWVGAKMLLLIPDVKVPTLLSLGVVVSVNRRLPIEPGHGGSSMIADADFRALRRDNAFASILHAAQAVTVALLATAFVLPVTGSYLAGPPGTDIQPPVRLFGIDVGWAVVAFLALSAVAHAYVAGPGAGRYRAALDRRCNTMRWIEYSLSATIMVVVIAQLVGVSDVVALIGIAGVNVAMILFGWLQERYEEPGGGWLPFVFGCIAGSVPWIAIGVMAWAPGATAEPPPFVYAIIVSLFAFFNVFAVNQWLQYRQIGCWRSYLVGERVYIVLSLTAKSALAWQVFAGTLVPR
jgi:tellurite resistance protein TerC